jgi:hypothetical protein
MKLIYLIIPTLGLVACADQHPESAASPSATSENIRDVSPSNNDDIREPGRVHTYIVNDYVDPNNPRLRHRGHLVDVVEQDAKWNLQPTDATGEPNLGPVTAVHDPNAAPNPYSAEFETELAQQRDQYRQLADLGGQMTAEMGKIQEMAEKSADAVAENAELRNRLNEVQQEIDTLKPVTPPVAPDAPKNPSWLDSILNLFREVPHGTPVVADKPNFQPAVQLRPAATNAPPPDPLTVSPPAQTNAPDETVIEGPVPSPGEMSQPPDASLPQP